MAKKYFIYFIKLIVLQTIIIGLAACSSPKTTIIKGPHKVTPKGDVVKATAQPGEILQKADLRTVGDKVVIPYGSKLDFDVAIDTEKTSIITYFNNEDRTVTFEVVAKKESIDIVFNNLCDIFVIPDPTIKINFIDKYNSNPRNKKKYKIILVPIFGNNCTVTGYLLRYDLKGVSKKCSSYKRIAEIEKKFKNCGKKGPCKGRTNCDEYRYFGICCP